MSVCVFFVLIIILINFNSLNFATSSNSARLGGNQPYNSFDNYIWGGIGEEKNEMYGWNITYIENLNGDEYIDLVVGSPWHGTGVENNKGAEYVESRLNEYIDVLTEINDIFGNENILFKYVEGDIERKVDDILALKR